MRFRKGSIALPLLFQMRGTNKTYGRVKTEIGKTLVENRKQVQGNPRKGKRWGIALAGERHHHLSSGIKVIEKRSFAATQVGNGGTQLMSTTRKIRDDAQRNGGAGDPNLW